MIISVTERGTFRRCKRMWDYASFNRQGLTPLVPPTALSFGGLIHKCHEHWLAEPVDENGDPIDVQSIVMKIATQGVRDIKERYLKRIGVEPDMTELQGYFDQVQLALEVMTNYQKHWGSSLPDGFTLMGAEQTIVVPIPGTEHLHSASILDVDPTVHSDTSCAQGANGLWLHQIEATLDALMKDEAERLWVLERKTYKNHTKLDVLQQTDQFVAYCWVLSQLGIGEVGGVYYDGMWKRVFEGKRTMEDLFTREPLIFSPEQIANKGLHIRDEAMDMAAPDLRIYPNRVWQGCWDCKFEDLCAATDRGEDTAYIRARKYVARERTEWQEEADD